MSRTRHTVSKSLHEKRHISLVWVSIRCESKIEKQDLQAREKWWQNSNFTTSQVQEQKPNENETEILIEIDGCKPRIRPKINWKNAETF